MCWGGEWVPPGVDKEVKILGEYMEEKEDAED